MIYLKGLLYMYQYFEGKYINVGDFSIIFIKNNLSVISQSVVGQ